MEPYILTQVTLSDNLAGVRNKARTGVRKNEDKVLLMQVKKFVHWYLSTSVRGAEEICRKTTIGYS